MQSLTKLILNNKIVEFRKPVRQSRVHCINKLSREVKKLKEKKGTDEQKAKNAKKAERFVQEILFMKTVKDDEISKFALLNDRTLIDITNDVNESLDTKALARLVHHKAVAKEVNSFREAFPDWKQSLPFLLETLGEKYKYKKPKSQKVRTPKNKKTKIKVNNEEWIVESVTTEDERKVPETLSEEKEIVENDVKFTVTKSEMGKKLKTKLEKEKKSIIETSSEKRSIVENEDVRNAVSDEDQKEDVPASQGTVDPFFLTKDNVEYISVSAKENVDNKIQETIVQESWKGEFARSKFKQSKFGFHDPKERSFNSNKFKPREQIRDKYGGRKHDRAFKNYSEEVPTQSSAVLHPSWEAKRKLAQPVRFEGKKIKFDPS